MKIAAILTLVVAGVVGASVFAKRHFDEQRLSQARSYVLAALKDPISAQFRNERLHEGVLCGELNSKNSMGGYVGFTRFVSTPADWAIEGTGRSKWERFNSDVLHAEIERRIELLKAALAMPEDKRVKPTEEQLLEASQAAGFDFVWSKMCGPVASAR